MKVAPASSASNDGQIFDSAAFRTVIGAICDRCYGDHHKSAGWQRDWRKPCAYDRRLVGANAFDRWPLVYGKGQFGDFSISTSEGTT